MLPVAIQRPSGEKATADTSLVLWPLRANNSLPVSASHTLAVPSELPVTIRWLSAEKATDRIPRLCPQRVTKFVPVRAAHPFAVMPPLPVTIRGPSDDIATDLIQPM